MKKTRRIRVAFISLLLVSCMLMPMIATGAAYIKGDVDGNGGITTADARQVLMVALGSEALTGDAFDAADFDSNGSISTSDARSVLMIALGGGTPAPTPEVLVATYDNTYKVLREAPIAGSATVMPTLAATVAGNESEGIQFILRDDSNSFKVKSITASNLVLQGGTGTIASSDITIFRQHYMYIDVHYVTYRGIGNGWYPDALIEMQYDYAHYPDGFTVAQGQNQGYWMTIDSAANQTPGVYTGTVTVVTDKGTLTIPVSCTVYDFSLSEEVHFKTLCVNGGLDDYEGQRAQYYNFLKEYRLNSAYLPVKDDVNLYDGSGATLSPNSDYEWAVEYAMNDSSPAYLLNLGARRGTVDGVYKFFDDFISLTNFLHTKTPGKMYALTADEPSWQLGQEWADEISWFTNIAKRDLPHVKTMVTFDTALPSATSPDGSIMRYVPAAWCIKPCNLLEGDLEDLHAHGQELWWYTCNWPVYPTVNTHIDSYLISARLLEWLEYDYDIDGYFLYSATTSASRRPTDATHTDTNPWVNPYSYLSQGSGSSDPAGDGYVVMVGLEGDGVIDANVPVPTVRLEALRDGMEDYEYLYMYEQKITGIAADLGVTVDNHDIMDMFYNNLYNGISDFSIDVTKLKQTRDDIASKIAEDVDFLYYISEESEELNRNSRVITVITDGTQPVTINGTAVNRVNGKYTLRVPLNETVYRSEYSVTVGTKTVKLYAYPDLVSLSDDMIDFDAQASAIAAANPSITTSVTGGVLTANLTSAVSQIVIPKTSLEAIANYSSYSHLRIKLETADNTPVPEWIIKAYTAANAGTTMTITSTPSGATVDILMTSILKVCLNRASTNRVIIALANGGNCTLKISDMTLIKKDFQDPSLVASTFNPARTWD